MLNCMNSEKDAEGAKKSVFFLQCKNAMYNPDRWTCRFKEPDSADGWVSAASISVLQDLTGEKGKNPSIHSFIHSLSVHLQRSS